MNEMLLTAVLLLSAIVLLLSAALLITVRAFFRQRERHRALRKEFAGLMHRRRRPIAAADMDAITGRRRVEYGQHIDEASSAGVDRAGESVILGSQRYESAMPISPGRVPPSRKD